MLRVRQYKELHSEQPQSVFYKMIHFVAVINDIDPSDVEDWNSDELVKEYDKCSKLLKVSYNYSKSITIDETELSLIDFTSITLGQFIDIESYILEDYLGNIDKIASVIYLHQVEGKMFESITENYSKVNINYRASLISELPIQSVLGAINSYLTFRSKFFESYDLFHNPLEGVDESNMDDEEKELYNEEKTKVDKEKTTQYMRVVNDLSNDDLTKFDDILSTNLFLAFNQLTYIISKKSIKK